MANTVLHEIFQRLFDPVSDWLNVNLKSLIAGEDLTNNILVGGAKTVTTQTQTNTSLANNASNSSSAIVSGIYRKYRAFAAGASGNLDLKLEVSPDNGVSGWYYINDSSGSQFPIIAGDLTAPYVRITVTNQAGITQTISAWLVLTT